MANIIFTDAESRMLKEILENYVSDLRMEIADTDKKDFRDDLKRKEEFINGLLKRLILPPK